MNDLYPLENLLDIIDQLPIRYLRNRAEKLLDDAHIVECFPGTNVPCTIDAGGAEDGTCIYKEIWHCCGEYNCSSGKADTKRKTRTHYCAAQMEVFVYATADAGKCLVRIREDTPVAHGSRFVAPAENHRYDWRSKVIIAQAAAAGVTTIGDLLSDRYWNEDVVPRPASKSERESLRCRLKQLRAKLAKEAKKRNEKQENDDEDEEKEDDEEEEEAEEAEEEESLSDGPERVLEIKEIDGARHCLVKWRNWPRSSATWEPVAEVPRELVLAFRAQANVAKLKQ